MAKEEIELLSSSANNNENNNNEKSFHDALNALDKPSNFVTQLVSESRVLRDLGYFDARQMEDILHLVTESKGESTTTESNAATEDDDDDDDDDRDDDGKSLSDKKVVVRLRHGCETTLARILSDEYATTTTNEYRKEQEEEDDNDTNSLRPNSSSCLGWSLAVLSINWCPALIDASLVRPVLKRKRDILGVTSSARDDAEIPIWSNRVDADGVVSLHVPGALAKRDKITELRGRILRTTTSEDDRSDDDPRDDGSSGNGSSVIVYVGDSSTDLAALLEADVGILIGNSGSATAMAERWGVEIVPLRHRGKHGFWREGVGGGGGGGGGRMDEKAKKVLWRVECWKEIDDMLIELDEYWS